MKVYRMRTKIASSVDQYQWYVAEEDFFLSLQSLQRFLNDEQQKIPKSVWADLSIHGESWFDWTSTKTLLFDTIEVRE